MTSQPGLSKETFLRLAEAAGLDVTSPHIEALYSYVRTVLRSLELLEEMDLTGVEPPMIFSSPTSPTVSERK